MPPALSRQAEWSQFLKVVSLAEEQFRRWREQGLITPAQAEALAADYRRQREAWQPRLESRAPLPTGIHFAPTAESEAGKPWAFRVWRFIGGEVHRHAAGGRLTLAQLHGLQSEVQERLAHLRRLMHEEVGGVVVAELIEETAARSPAQAEGDAPRASAPSATEPPPRPSSPLERRPAATSAPRPSETARPSVGESPFQAREFGEGAPSAATRVEPGKSLEPAGPRRSLLELILDPRSIQWLLALGGALMVVGLVILLWVNEWLTPPLVALILAVANGAVLAGGYALLLKTRFQLAGRAVTLLACLVMPLNLWYYQSHQLLTIDGHLWLAGVVLCALYAASAWLLRDEMFVYVLMGGVTLTGLLMLADLPPSPQHFWEITSPATLLVVLGLLAIHGERAFPEDDGPFGRRRFGLAFFWSGHALLAAGLALVLAAQVAGRWLYEPIFRPLFERWQATPSPLVTVDSLRLLALGLVLAGTYAYVYSDVVVRRLGIYVHIAAFTLLWAGLLVLDLLNWKIGVDALIAAMAITALVVNLLWSSVARDQSLARSMPVLGLLLGLFPVALGGWIYCQAISLDIRGVWQEYPPTWSYVAAMALTAAACRVGALVHRDRRRLEWMYFFATAAATLMAAVALLAYLGLTTWPQHAPWLMVIPLAYLVAAWAYRDRSPAEPLRWVAHVATVVLLASSLAWAFDGFTEVRRDALNLTLSLFFLEVTVFFALGLALHRQLLSLHMATVMGCATLWQLLNFWGVPGEYYTLIFASAGVILLIGYRFAIVQQLATGPLAEAAFQAANTLLSLSFVAAILIGLSRLTAPSIAGEFLALCVTLTLLSLAAAALSRHNGWRRWYVVSSVAEGLLLFLAVTRMSDLSGWQKMEIFLVAIGLLLLVVGHVGWYRERERQSDTVSLCLFLGSLLAGIPLAIATLIDRSSGHWLPLNELGFLAVSILLLATGLMFQLKATTMTGAALTAVYSVSLLIFVPWGRLNTVALAMTLGGAFVFGTGLFLSLYRERLLTLPTRIKHREGIFRVLTWR